MALYQLHGFDSKRSKRGVLLKKFDLALEVQRSLIRMYVVVLAKEENKNGALCLLRPRGHPMQKYYDTMVYLSSVLSLSSEAGC